MVTEVDVVNVVDMESLELRVKRGTEVLKVHLDSSSMPIQVRRLPFMPVDNLQYLLLVLYLLGFPRFIFFYFFKPDKIAEA